MASTVRQCALLVTLVSSHVSAAPQLRLANSVVEVQTAVGAAAPVQTLEAFNIGDGMLSLSVSVPPSVTWMSASVGAAGPCVYIQDSPPCIQLSFTFNTTNLAPGTYSADVTVSDQQAIDAPQTVVVVVQVGSAGPVAVDRYLAPGTTSDIPFTLYAPGDKGFCSLCPSVNITTQDGGQWLTLATAGEGTLPFLYSYFIHLAPPANMPTGTYTGSVAITNSTDSRTIPVTMRLTTQPIAVPSTSHISLRLAEDGPAAAYPFLAPISLANAGMEALEVQDVTATGPEIGAYEYAGLGFVTVDPGSLTPGIYTDGSVTMDCNAANCPVQVPLSLEIVPQSSPLLYYQGVVDNVTFTFADVAPGDVLVAAGEQLSLSAPVFAGGAPLPTSLGGTSVSIDGVPAPLYYSSFGQIAFQMPSATPLGSALVQVERNGQAGNTISVNVARLAPRIVVATDLSYNPCDATHPIGAGEELILWAIGLGPTNPAVPDGTPGPASPPSVVTVVPTVQFIGQGTRVVAPGFAGLSAGGVGLYQVMVTVPADTPAGLITVGLLYPTLTSNTVSIAVQ
jgi:uncharacterized protein (TIGR03437 family)